MAQLVERMAVNPQGPWFEPTWRSARLLENSLKSQPVLRRVRAPFVDTLAPGAIGTRLLTRNLYLQSDVYIFGGQNYNKS